MVVVYQPQSHPGVTAVDRRAVCHCTCVVGLALGMEVTLWPEKSVPVMRRQSSARHKRSSHPVTHADTRHDGRRRTDKDKLLAPTGRRNASVWFWAAR